MYNNDLKRFYQNNEIKESEDFARVADAGALVAGYGIKIEDGIISLDLETAEEESV